MHCHREVTITNPLNLWTHSRYTTNKDSSSNSHWFNSSKLNNNLWIIWECISMSSSKIFSNNRLDLASGTNNCHHSCYHINQLARVSGETYSNNKISSKIITINFNSSNSSMPLVVYRTNNSSIIKLLQRNNFKLSINR